MEQFRHIGEVLGSLKALMVLRDDIQINQRQCCLILEIFSLAFDTIADEIRQNLKLEERNTKWKSLENPLRELCGVFREGELYIRQCLDSKEWWGKAITLSQNSDCVEFHIHNLLCCFPAVIEAIENAGEISGIDEDEMEKKKVMVTMKYDMEWNDPKLFQWRYGKQYLVPREICKQLENAWREDRWRLIEALKEKKIPLKTALTKNEQRLADLLLKKLLNESDKLNTKLFPSAILLDAKDYQVRRRLGHGGEFKEIQWLGQSFALRHFHVEIPDLEVEITTLLSLSHPNILQYLCGFYDEEKREVFLVMELMSKDLWSYMKENSGPRRQILFSIPVVVDLMLQMARGMEYLHSRKIYHGDLNPCNILLKTRNSQEGYFQAKIAGLGLSSVNNDTIRNSPSHSPIHEDINPYTWYAPEVLTELEKTGIASNSKYSEKADVYSFGMICFELLTGKVPFEDHLQGERTNRNIKAGERPLFPYPSPKYLVSLIKKCWQTEPTQRPSFSSICRILRYIKKFLAMNSDFLVVNPELSHLKLQTPPVDYCDIEAMFFKNVKRESASKISSVSQIPYEMFVYKVSEKEKTSASSVENKSCKSPKDEAPKTEASVCRDENDDEKKVCGNENVSIVENPPPLAPDIKSISSDSHSACSEVPVKKRVTINKQTEEKANKGPGTPNLRPTRTLSVTTRRCSIRTNKGDQSPLTSSPLSPGRRRPSHVLGSSSDRDCKNKKGSQSPLVSSPSSLVRRKKYSTVSDSPRSNFKIKKGNESPMTRNDQVSDSMSSLKTKKGNQLQLTLSPLSTGRLRHAKTDTISKMEKGNMSPYAMMSPLSTCTRRHGHDSAGGFRITRGRLSPSALSPLSPYARRMTSGNISDPESSPKIRRGRLSPLALSPLSPYARTCGHVSD